MRSFCGRLALKLRSHLLRRHAIGSSLHSVRAVESAINEPPSTDDVEDWETQFVEFRSQNKKAWNLRMRIRCVSSEIESAAESLRFQFLHVRDFQTTEILESLKEPISVVADLYGKLGKIIQECPDDYYRYHTEWSSVTQTVVSLVAFIHWIGTGTLLPYSEAKGNLGTKSSEFELDVEDYLIGLCIMSNDLPRYAMKRGIAGDRDCPKKASELLLEMEEAFCFLNLSNDILREKFEGMMYDNAQLQNIVSDTEHIAQRERFASQK